MYIQFGTKNVPAGTLLQSADMFLQEHCGVISASATGPK
jgi:hypothetical protein